MFYIFFLQKRCKINGAVFVFPTLLYHGVVCHYFVYFWMMYLYRDFISFLLQPLLIILYSNQLISVASELVGGFIYFMMYCKSFSPLRAERCCDHTWLFVNPRKPNVWTWRASQKSVYQRSATRTLFTETRAALSSLWTDREQRLAAEMQDVQPSLAFHLPTPSNSTSFYSFAKSLYQFISLPPCAFGCPSPPQRASTTSGGGGPSLQRCCWQNQDVSSQRDPGVSGWDKDYFHLKILRSQKYTHICSICSSLFITAHLCVLRNWQGERRRENRMMRTVFSIQQWLCRVCWPLCFQGPDRVQFSGWWSKMSLTWAGAAMLTLLRTFPEHFNLPWLLCWTIRARRMITWWLLWGLYFVVDLFCCCTQNHELVN